MRRKTTGDGFGRLEQFATIIESQAGKISKYYDQMKVKRIPCSFNLFGLVCRTIRSSMNSTVCIDRGIRISGGRSVFRVLRGSECTYMFCESGRIAPRFCSSYPKFTLLVYAIRAGEDIYIFLNYLDMINV